MGDGFPAAMAHGPIEEPFEGIFTVRGTARLAPLFSITRNMVILRNLGELTIVGAVRLSAEGERALERLGTIRHLVKLGHFHGIDDPYYVKKYSPVVWAAKGAAHKAGVTTDELLSADGAGPVPRAEVFTFDRAAKPEACLLLHRDDGILVTCDSVQNWGNFDGCSFAGRMLGKAMGFGGAARIGPGWRRVAEPKDMQGFRPDFERLLALPFRHLLPAHGYPLKDSAKDALAARVAAAYPATSSR
jgi:hypothetical protein